MSEMRRKIGGWAALLCLALVAAGCLGRLPRSAQATRTLSPEQATPGRTTPPEATPAGPAFTPTPLPPAASPSPSPEPLPPSRTPFPPTPTPTLAFPVSLGTAFPLPGGAISPEAKDLVQLASYGAPAVSEMFLSPDETTLILRTPYGLEFYDARTRQFINSLEIEPLPGEGTLSASREASRLLIVSTGGVQILTREGDPVQLLPVEPVFTVGGNQHPVRAALSPDGEAAAVVVCEGALNQCAFKVFEISSNRELLAGRADYAAQAPLFSPDGRLLGVEVSSRLQFWETAGWVEAPDLYLGPNTRWSFSADGALLAISRLHQVDVRRVRDRILVRSFTRINRAESRHPKVLFSPNGTSVAVLDEGHVLSVWDLSTGLQLSSQFVRYEEAALYRLGDSGRLISTGGPVRSVSYTSERPGAFVFLPQEGDPALLVVNDFWDGERWYSETCRLSAGEGATCQMSGWPQVVGTDGGVYTLRSGSDSRTVAAVGASGEASLTLQTGGGLVRPCGISPPEGGFLYSVYDPLLAGREQVFLRRLSDGRVVGSWRSVIGLCARSPHNSLVTAQIDLRLGRRVVNNSLLVVDLQSGGVLYEENRFEPVDALAVSPGGTVLLARFSPEEGGSRLLLLGPEAAEMLPASGLVPGRVTAVEVNPGETMLALGFEDGSVALYAFDGSAISAEPFTRLHSHRLPVRELAFSPSGALLATYSTDGFIHIWGPDS